MIYITLLKVFEKFLKMKEVLSNPEKKDKVDVPSTNEGAKKAATGDTKDAKKLGATVTEAAQKAAEAKEKPKSMPIIIGGKTVDKTIVDGKPVFTENENGKPIADLSVWMEGLMKDAKLQAEIEAHLKPFKSYFKQLGDKERDDAVKKFNGAAFTKIEFEKDKDPVEKAAVLASALSEKSDATSLTISQSALDKMPKHKAYVDYQHVLPANVKTIVVERGGEKFVCSREIGSPEKGGRVSYTNVITGERVYLKGGDKIRIVGTVSFDSQEYKNASAREQKYAEVRSATGKTWKKDSDTPIDLNPRSSVVSGGGGGSSVDGRASSGGSGGGSVGGFEGRATSGSTGGPDASKAAGQAPATASTQAPATAPTQAPAQATAPVEEAKPAPSLSQTPEVMKQNSVQETFRVPGNKMFASMLSPNPQKYPNLGKSEPKLMVYFAGRGHYDAISKWYKENGPSKEPPQEVLAEAAREDFVTRIFPMLEDSWKRGENVHCVLVSHMRPYLSSTDSDSGSAKHWYNELGRQDSATALLGSIVSKYKEKSGAKDIKNINLVGHSMGGKALAGIMELKGKGLLPYEFSYYSSDATYWNFQLGEFKRNPKVSLYVSYRPGTNTEKQAKSIITSLGLKGQKTGNDTVYTNPNYPNVKVVESSAAHSDHTGKFLKPAWELAQRAQTGNSKQDA